MNYRYSHLFNDFKSFCLGKLTKRLNGLNPRMWFLSWVSQFFLIRILIFL